MSGWNDHQQKIVDHVLSDARWLIEHERIEFYSEVRPYRRPARPPTTKLFNGDCTGTVKLVLCDWNGIPQIDGEPSGFGNTRTFAQAPRRFRVSMDPHDWQPLDVLLYKHHSGPFVGGPGEHAAFLMEKRAGVWMCFSMGSNPGPKLERFDYRNDLALVLRYPIPLK